MFVNIHSHAHIVEL